MKPVHCQTAVINALNALVQRPVGAGTASTFGGSALIGNSCVARIQPIFIDIQRSES
jgi:hypothetical protein